MKRKVAPAPLPCPSRTPFFVEFQTSLQAPFILVKHLPTLTAIFARHKPRIPTMLTHEAGDAVAAMEMEGGRSCTRHVKMKEKEEMS